jgi:hypothetical protein
MTKVAMTISQEIKSMVLELLRATEIMERIR